MDLTVRRRTRLTPEARRGLILDTAAKTIVAEGLGAMTMEGLARNAGISKGLVYAYFPNRDALLRAMIEREQAALRSRGMDRALAAQGFADLIGQTTRVYLEHCRDRGALIAALMADAGASRLMEAESLAERDATVRYFVRAVRRAYGQDLKTAISVVDMLMAVTGRAGAQVAAGDIDVPEAEALVVRMITGALGALAR